MDQILSLKNDSSFNIDMWWKTDYKDGQGYKKSSSNMHLLL